MPARRLLPLMRAHDAQQQKRPICHIALVDGVFTCTVCWRAFSMAHGRVEDVCNEGGTFTITIAPKPRQQL
jgi:hypothetical protein